MTAADSERSSPNHRSRTSNRRGDGQRLRAETVEAAMRLLEELPIQSLSLRAIAREAGITATAIYMHFDNRDEMVLELARTAWRGLADAMRAADEQAAPLGVLAQVRAQVHSYLTYALASPTRYQLLFMLEPNPAVMTDTHLGQPAAPVYHVLEEAVKRCARAGVPLLIDSEFDMMVLIFVIAHGRVALSHAAPGSEFSRPDIIRSYVDTALDAVFPEGPGRGPDAAAWPTYALAVEKHRGASSVPYG